MQNVLHTRDLFSCDTSSIKRHPPVFFGRKNTLLWNPGWSAGTSTIAFLSSSSWILLCRARSLSEPFLYDVIRPAGHVVASGTYAPWPASRLNGSA